MFLQAGPCFVCRQWRKTATKWTQMLQNERKFFCLMSKIHTVCLLSVSVFATKLKRAQDLKISCYDNLRCICNLSFLYEDYVTHHQRCSEIISQSFQDHWLVAIPDQTLHIPGRVGSPRSGTGRASTGSTATKDGTLNANWHILPPHILPHWHTS